MLISNVQHTWHSTVKREGSTASITIAIPDDKHARLQELADLLGVSVDRFVEQLLLQTVAAVDAQARFRQLAAKGNTEEAGRILDKLDAAFGKHQS